MWNNVPPMFNKLFDWLKHRFNTIWEAVTGHPLFPEAVEGAVPGGGAQQGAAGQSNGVDGGSAPPAPSGGATPPEGGAAAAPPPSAGNVPPEPSPAVQATGGATPTALAPPPATGAPGAYPGEAPGRLGLSYFGGGSSPPLGGATGAAGIPGGGARGAGPGGARTTTSGGSATTPPRAAPRYAGGNAGRAGQWMNFLMHDPDLHLTREQAAGVVGNLSHESGGFTQYHEGGKPWNRGGVGDAQWTGPRRLVFENWAASQGLNPRSFGAIWIYEI